MDTTPQTPVRPGRWTRLAARLHLRQVLSRDLLVLAALSGLAITQPLLDLFGRNPEFFVAQNVPSGEIVAFALVVTFLVPIVCLVVELTAYAVGAGVGRVVHVGLVFVLATVLGLSLAHQLGAGDVGSVAIALAVGVGLTAATVRVPVVDRILRYLSGALVLFLVAFLFFSRTGELIRAGEAAAAEGVGVGNPAPVVVVQLDEFPTASLLDGEGAINAERFPNFARLADEASWFRNARTVSASTPQSVSAAVDGLEPDPDALPISSDHPRTVFTLLGEDYRMVVDEQVTDLCPSSVCEGAATEEAESAGLGSTLRDARVVFGHIVLPPFLADGLPAVDQAWGGFIADDRIEEAPAEVPSASGSTSISSVSAIWNSLGSEGWSPRFQSGVLERQTDAIDRTDEPTLWYSHAVFPHAPWHLAPGGLRFEEGRAPNPGVGDDGWTEEEWLVRQGLQRHLLQVGYADTLIGGLIDRLQEVGLWEEALVVVLADHGVAFEPGRSPRAAEPGTEAEIFNVPLFIKAPGVTRGETRDDDALTIDVLPSIVDLLDVETDWEFDGRSLFGDRVDDGRRPVARAAAPGDGPVDFDDVMRVAERNRSWLPHGDDMASIAAVGDLGDLVGLPVESLDVVGGSDVRWSVDQVFALADWRPAETGYVPLWWNGTVTMPDGGPPPSELLAVVNGRVAGVVGGFGAAGGPADGFSAVIAGEALSEGPNEASLLVPVDGPRRFEQTARPG